MQLDTTRLASKVARPMMGHVRIRRLTYFPATVPVHRQKILRKSLFQNNLPISYLFLLLCTGNRTYLQQNKEVGERE